MSNAPLLVIENLTKYFNTAAGQLYFGGGQNPGHCRRVRLW